MHILLTRPLEDSREMILKFQSLGHDVSHIPLINIESKNYESINFSNFNGIIFTSTNAIKFLNLNLIDKFYEFISIEDIKNGSLDSPKLDLSNWNQEEGVQLLGKDKLVIYIKKELCLQV